jgi:hypothetical protein
MLKNILLFVLSILSYCTFAQDYPELIMPFSSKSIESGSDTLWILRDSQLKKAIISAKKLEIEEDISSELRKKVALMEQKDVVKDSLIADLKNDRDYYIKNWKTCNSDIDLLLIKQKRQKLFTRLSFAGIAVAFVAGILIGK